MDQSQKSNCKRQWPKSRKRRQKKRDRQWPSHWYCPSCKLSPLQEQPKKGKLWGGNVGEGYFCDSCDDKALIVWDWNACGLSGESLSELVQGLGREQNWDVLLLQETLKHVSATNRSCEGGILIHAEGGARGAPAIILGKRVAPFLRETKYGRDFVMARLELVPPVLVWSFHAPQPQFSIDSFEESLVELQQAFDDLSKGSKNNMLQIGGGDLNTQVGPLRNLIGRFAKGERQADKERARAIYGFLSASALSLVNSFFPGGFTRFPVTGRAEAKPSQIDFFLKSQRVWAKPLQREMPFRPPKWPQPALLCFHNKETRQEREERSGSRNLLAAPINWARRVPASWVPTSGRAYKVKIRQEPFGQEPQICKNFRRWWLKRRKAPRSGQQDETQRTLRELYQNLRSATCPLLRKAYQILLNAQTTKRRRESGIETANQMGYGEGMGFWATPPFQTEPEGPPPVKWWPGQS